VVVFHDSPKLFVNVGQSLTEFSQIYTPIPFHIAIGSVGVARWTWSTSAATAIAWGPCSLSQE
jgi:hypothetical protein